VPQDFTDFLLEDHEALPREVRHYATSVGAIAIEWYRNYWILKGLEK
jgi:hypothetical protein